MARVQRNFEFKDEKLARWRRQGGGLSYYAWCVAAIRESPTFGEFRRLIGDAAWDEQRCIQGLLALRRDYDHIASDSELSESDASDSDDGGSDGGGGGGGGEGWQPFDAELLVGGGQGGGQHPAAHWIAPHKKRPRGLDPLVSEAIACYVESPGFASRLLHHDGSNRTRSGRRFGGTNARLLRLAAAAEREATAETSGKSSSSSTSSADVGAAAAAAAADHRCVAVGSFFGGGSNSSSSTSGSSGRSGGACTVSGADNAPAAAAATVVAAAARVATDSRAAAAEAPRRSGPRRSRSSSRARANNSATDGAE
jgi:hypothetical protein